MTITLTLDQEQQDALDAMLADYNASASSSLTAEEYLATVLHGAIAGKVKQRYDAALHELGSAAASLSYEARSALIAQVRAAIEG